MSNATTADTPNAVLVRLRISQFGNNRNDRRLTAEVKRDKQLGDESGNWTKHRFPPGPLKAIGSVASKLRQAHYALTLPYEDGQRIVTSGTLARYEAEVANMRTAFNDAINALAPREPMGSKEKPDYNWMLAEARQMHNGRFDASEYTDWDGFKAQFAATVQFTPFPAASHFINTVSGSALARMRADLTAQNDTRIRQAVADTWWRLIQPVRHMAEKLASPDAVFRDTLVDNVREMTALIPALNLTNDSRLTGAARDIETAFAGLSAQTLRENKVERKAVAEAAARIVAQFGSLGVRKLDTGDEADE